MTQTVAPAALMGGLFGVLVALGAREIWIGSPGIVRWARASVEPLLRAGREGYEPSRDEGRRLGVVIGLASAVLGWFTLGWPVAVPLALAGPLLSRRLVGFRRDRYRRRVEAALPEVANALADALSAGRSLRTALFELGDSLDGAAATEFALLATELGLGDPTAQSVRRLSERIGSPRVEALVAALLAGRESGGDLSEVMRRFAAGAEAHERALREARSATAQARFTGLLVAGMPIGAALFTELVSPGFLVGLAGSPASMAMVAVALALQGVGFAVIRRLSRQAAV